MALTGPCVVTVGTYDGVHLGHRHLLAQSLAEGAARGLPTVVVTFDRHPAEVVRPEHAPKLLTGLEHKVELLEATGVDEVVLLHFDLERSRESAEDFVLSYLLDELGAVAVLVGSNFRYGHRHAGDLALLRALTTAHGATARGVDLVFDNESRLAVSSTAIRQHLFEGRVGEAARLLGRAHEVRGVLAAGRLLVPDALCLPAPAHYGAEAGALGGSFRPVAAVVGAATPIGELHGAEALVVEGVAELPPGEPVALRFLFSPSEG